MNRRRQAGRVQVSFLLFVTLVVGAAGWLFAQTVPPTEPPNSVLRVTTRLVLVDVVVTDKQGRPITGLTERDFTLWEDGKLQNISVFSFDQPSQQAQEPPLPPLPANVFTNEPAYRRPPGPMTILLLDVLNTPWGEQAYAREQMVRYLKTQLRPDQRVAILVLTGRLGLLQDFTSDPRLLITALENYRTPTPGAGSPQEDASQLLDMTQQMVMVGPIAMAAMVDMIIRLETEQAVASVEQRAAITLDALEKIARAVGGYRGRKNLIWVSAAFPLALTPDRIGRFNRADQAGLFRSYAARLRETASLLADAQVAVYPVDARGLVGAAIGEAESISLGTVGVGPGAANSLRQSANAASMTHDTMNELAKETGGRAFYNRNDIDQALASSVADGSTYYTLGYYPQHRSWDGKFHRVQVQVQRPGVEVRHRRGYYANELLQPVDAGESLSKEEKKERELELLAAIHAPLPATGVSFRATVLPPPAAQRSRVDVQLQVDPATVVFEPAAGGVQRCSLDFLTAAYSPSGEMVDYVYQTLDAGLRPETYARVRKEGLPYKAQLDLPPGNYILRVAVRDNRTARLGSLEIPLLLSAPKNTP